MKEPLLQNSCKNVRQETFKAESWLQSNELDEICTGQRKDKDLKLIIEWKLKDTKPTWQDIPSRNINLKNYWSQRNILILKDNVLYREWFNTKVKQPVWQLVIPTSLKEDLFSLLQKWGHGVRVVTLSPPTSEVRVRFPAPPQVGKLVVACRWLTVYSTEP